MTKIILLSGPAGSGKSTARRYISKMYEYEPFRLSFAGPLKEMIKAVFNLTEAHVSGHLKEVPLWILGGKTTRYAMQTVGTEWGRDIIHPDIWVRQAIQSVKNLEAEHGEDITVIFDDVRFQNEIDGMREVWEDTRSIQIRPGFEGYTPISNSEHASEVQYLEWDVLIANKWGLDDFKKQLREAML